MWHWRTWQMDGRGIRRAWRSPRSHPPHFTSHLLRDAIKEAQRFLGLLPPPITRSIPRPPTISSISTSTMASRMPALCRRAAAYRHAGEAYLRARGIDSDFSSAHSASTHASSIDWRQAPRSFQALSPPSPTHMAASPACSVCFLIANILVRPMSKIRAVRFGGICSAMACDLGAPIPLLPPVRASKRCCRCHRSFQICPSSRHQVQRIWPPSICPPISHGSIIVRRQ